MCEQDFHVPFACVRVCVSACECAPCFKTSAYVYLRSTYGGNELHFHFKATSRQQQKLLSSINVILRESERDSETRAERNTQQPSNKNSPGC